MRRRPDVGCAAELRIGFTMLGLDVFEPFNQGTFDSLNRCLTFTREHEPEPATSGGQGLQGGAQGLAPQVSTLQYYLKCLYSPETRVALRGWF